MERTAITDVHIREFEAYLNREEKTPATQEKYLRDVRSCMAFADGRPVTKELIVAWKKSLIDKGYAVRSINSMLASVNSLLMFLGWYECKVKNIRLQQQTYCPEGKELTKEEYLRLLEASEDNCRLNLILQTICSTGIRVSELCYFTVEALYNGEICVNCKSKTRTILVPRMLRRMLLDYAKEEGIRSGPVFQGKNGKPLDRSYIWRQMKRLCVMACVQETKVFPHNLRKLFARTFYRTEKDIAKLADILGHGSINTTRIYLISTGTEHRKKIEQLDLLMCRPKESGSHNLHYVTRMIASKA